MFHTRALGWGQLAVTCTPYVMDSQKVVHSNEIRAMYERHTIFVRVLDKTQTGNIPRINGQVCVSSTYFR